jgi:membrane peptidoglycan carboxypeptidase
VTNAAGDTVLRAKPECKRVLAPDVAAAATDILYGVPLRGTGRRNGRIGRPNAAKTGTTDNYADAWYAGYTPQVATVVWLGFSEGNDKPLKNIHGLPEVFGGSLPAQIWARYMRFAHRGLAIEEFPKAPKEARVEVPDVVGKTLGEATKILEDAGFTVEVEKDASGKVTSQSPEAGEKVGEGSTVVLSTSGGGDEPTPTPSPTASPKPSPSKKND